MKSIFYRAIVLSISASVLTACVSSGGSKAPESTVTPISVEGITYKVPDEDGVLARNGLVKDLSFPGMFNVIRKGQNEKLFYGSKTESTFVAHRRSDNGIAGSGIKYLVRYNVVEGDLGYSVNLKPTEFMTYQEGFVGKFPVPNFSSADLLKSLSSSSLRYKFELESPYNTESVYSNFVRLAQSERFRAGEKDSITGKIYKDRFIIRNRDKNVRFVIETYPYRNGSKVVAYTTIPSVETSENTIDFAILIREVEQQLKTIVES